MTNIHHYCCALAITSVFFLIQQLVFTANLMWHEDGISHVPLKPKCIEPKWHMVVNHWWKHVHIVCVHATECLGVCVSPRVPVRGGSVRGERQRPWASVCPGPSGSAEEPPCSGDTLFPAYTFSSSVYTPVIYGWRHDQLVSTQSLRHICFEGLLLLSVIGAICRPQVNCSHISNLIPPVELQ